MIIRKNLKYYQSIINRKHSIDFERYSIQYGTSVHRFFYTGLEIFLNTKGQNYLRRVRDVISH